MSDGPVLIIQIPRGSAVAAQLAGDPPAAVAAGDAVVEHGVPDAEGALEASEIGEVVLAFPSPEGLRREGDEVRRVLRHHATGTEPLVIAIGDAEELRDDELAVVLEAARHASRPVILRVERS